MKKLRFCLIGDGQIANYHRKAIGHVNGELEYVFDPKHKTHDTNIEYVSWNNKDVWSCDYFVIASPSHIHRGQIQFVLQNSWASSQIICEKPAFLPWESAVETDRLNIVLQLRYYPGLPQKADIVKAIFVRNEEYFKTWKGDARKTGGLFFNLFIHYIDLAIQLGADFEGMVSNSGDQERKIVRGPFGLDEIDILNIDMQTCYNRLYEDVLSGGGIKPKDVFYLNWVLHRNSEIFGYGRNGLNKLIKIGKELL